MKQTVQGAFVGSTRERGEYGTRLGEDHGQDRHDRDHDRGHGHDRDRDAWRRYYQQSHYGYVQQPYYGYGYGYQQPYYGGYQQPYQYPQYQQPYRQGGFRWVPGYGDQAGHWERDRARPY